MEELFEITKIKTNNIIFKVEGVVNKISYDYLIFEKEDEEELDFTLVIQHCGNDLLKIYYDIIKDKYIKNNGNRYIIKLPMKLIILDRYLEVGFPVYFDHRLIIDTKNKLTNKELICRVAKERYTINPNVKEVLVKYIKQCPCSYYNLGEHVYGIFIRSKSKIQNIKLRILGINIFDFDEFYINSHSIRINKNTIYISFKDYNNINMFDKTSLINFSKFKSKFEIFSKNNDETIQYFVTHNILCSIDGQMLLKYCS